MYNLMLTLHILAAGVLIGIVVFSLVLTIKNPVNRERLITVQTIRKLGPAAAIILIFTGVSLISQNPSILKEKMFFAKIILFISEGIIAEIIINRKIKNALTLESEQPIPTNPMFIWTLSSVVIVIAIVALGVML